MIEPLFVILADRDGVHQRTEVRKEAAMSAYRVVCVETKEPNEGIIAVGTNASGETKATARRTVKEVREKIKLGHRVYTKSISTGIEAEVELYGDHGITTSADGVADNNLDNLRACSWK